MVPPVVLLPVRALTGLNEEQNQAVIAHELAHIRGSIAFVNLFPDCHGNAAVLPPGGLVGEPADSRGTRALLRRRSHSDLRRCGELRAALTLMEEWRTAPALLMAANRSPLGERVVRLLGLNGATGGYAWRNGSQFCLSGGGRCWRGMHFWEWRTRRLV